MFSFCSNKFRVNFHYFCPISFQMASKKLCAGKKQRAYVNTPISIFDVISNHSTHVWNWSTCKYYHNYKNAQWYFKVNACKSISCRRYRFIFTTLCNWVKWMFFSICMNITNMHIDYWTSCTKNWCSCSDRFPYVIIKTIVFHLGKIEVSLL